MRTRVIDNGGRIAQNSGRLPYYDITGGGGVSDGDKGDITVSGGGTVWTIDNDTVTAAKLRDSAPFSVIGNDLGVAGDPIDIQASTGFPAALAYQDDSALVTWLAGVNGVLRTTGVLGHLEFNTVQTADIGPSQVTYDKIQDGAANSVLGRLVNFAGTLGDIQISAAGVWNEVFTFRRDIAQLEWIPCATDDGLVLRNAGDNLEFGQITTVAIQGHTVTYAKIQEVTDSPVLLGLVSSTAPGDIEQVSLGDGFIIDGSTIDVIPVAEDSDFLQLDSDLDRLIGWLIELLGEVPAVLSHRLERALATL